MRSSGRHYYCNTLFDLQLGGFSTNSLKLTAAEMTTLFMPLMRQGDVVHLDVEPCNGYESYLSRYGLGPLCQCGMHDACVFLSTETVVWGQNDTARQRISESLKKIPDFPPVDIVREINGRKFCRELGLEYGCGVPNSQFCMSMKEVHIYAKQNAGFFPLVIKAAHGGFGAGIHRFESASKLKESGVIIEKYLTHGGLIIEPWLERYADISSLVQIYQDGTISDVVIQMQRINRYGGFFGIEAPAEEQIRSRWGEEIDEKTKVFAAEAARNGYYGPFGCDSFITVADRKLMFGIEINARFTMGMFAHAIRHLTGFGKYSLLRIISSKKCDLPADYHQWQVKCVKIQYNHDTNEGVLLLTPLRIKANSDVKQPRLNIFFLTANKRQKLIELDKRLQLLIKQ